MKTSEKFQAEVLPHLKTKEEISAAMEEIFKTATDILNKHKISPATVHVDMTVGGYYQENNELELMIGRAKLGTQNLGHVVEQRTRSAEDMEDFTNKVVSTMVESMMSDEEYVGHMAKHVHDAFEHAQEEEQVDPMAMLAATLGLGNGRPMA